MKMTKYALLICIAKIIEAHGGNYSYASQEKYIDLLEAKHGVKIGRRMINYHMADLEAEGLIKRVRRTHRNADGTLALLTTAICLTIAGCKYLAMKGVKWAWAKMNALIKKYIPASGARAPQQAEEDSKNNATPGDTLKRIAGEAKAAGKSLHEYLSRLKNSSGGAQSQVS